MKSFKRNILFTFLAIVSFFTVLVLPASAANDGWTYANNLPSGITSAKYTIQYNNVYRKTAKTSPGIDWTNKGYAYSQYENSGEPYFSNIELPTGDTRVALGYNYYHWCGRNTGVRVNFTMSGAYNHYDGINPGNFYEAAVYTDDDDPRYKAYRLKYYDGGDVYCYSGFSCDGSYGTHGGHSYIWYKTTKYQDRVKVNYYNYEKQSGWTSKADTAAYSYAVRYKLNHTHTYTEWKVSQKATFTKDGSQYRLCTGCKDKQTAKISKLSSVKLSKTAYSYNGKTKKPTVTVKNSNGSKIDSKYYTVKYSTGRKDIGTYKVTVKLKGSCYSGTKTLKFKIVPPQIKNLKAKTGKNSVTLQWDKVSGKNIKYRVYSYNSATKKLTYLQTLTANKITYKSLKSSAKYSFVVKASRKIGDTTYYSKESAPVTVQPYGKPEKVGGLKASSKTSETVTLKWNKASGNKVVYYVYSYNSSNGKYKKLGKTSSNKYTVKNLKPKKTYKYAVRAYSSAGKGYYGSMSAVYTVKTNAKPKAPSVGTVILSTERKLNTVSVKWTANSNATGYKIYRSTTGKDDSYVCIKKIESSAVSSFTDTTVLPAKTYYYKVRSYKKNGSEVAHGSYSSAKKITTYSAWEEINFSKLAFSFVNSRNENGFMYKTEYEDVYGEDYRIPKDSFRVVFGDTVLADEMYKKYNEDGKAWNGSCQGMAMASGLFNVRTSGIRVSDFNSKAQKVSDLNVKDKSTSLGINLTRFIEALQVSQISSYIEDNWVCNDLNKLISAVNNGTYTGKPVVICVENKEGAHALLGYWAYWPNNSEVRIQVYDCNYSSEYKEIVVYKNEKGKYIGWSYDDEYGTAYSEPLIGYIEYDDYSLVWTNRNKFKSSIAKTNTLITNSDNLSIYDESNKLVAVMSDGKIIKGDGDIYVVDEFGASDEKSDSTIMYMPTDKTYTIVNNDGDIATFEATMVNVDRSAQVSTEADCVTFTVSDNEEVNSVCIDTEGNDDYCIVLDYSESLEKDTVEVIGTGDGEAVNIAQEGQELSFDNCEGAKVNIG